MATDTATAEAFAASWNSLPEGSIYTKEQFEDWLSPVDEKDVRGKRVLELGCGNGSLMVHLSGWNPGYLEGVDLGSSVISARKNLGSLPFKNWEVTKGDMTSFTSPGFDLVYSIGVLHHLKDPRRGFESVIRNTKAGGRFHCWVYAREGNAAVRYLVDPIRNVVSHLPWRFTKYFVATPLAIPFFIYAKLVASIKPTLLAKKLPLYEYSRWIAKREFAFFRHVAFDQLVTPQTTYIPRSTLEKWLAGSDRVAPQSAYIIMRNGNSWKFGGTIKS
ncbi:MAG: hypothetical protein QOG91_150 [Candidatus Parcubacteria bacterium]|nr:hypothetical protein [Candidatus Parcubacteria bacterium]